MPNYPHHIIPIVFLILSFSLFPSYTPIPRQRYTDIPHHTVPYPDIHRSTVLLTELHPDTACCTSCFVTSGKNSAMTPAQVASVGIWFVRCEVMGLCPCFSNNIRSNSTSISACVTPLFWIFSSIYP